MEQERAKLVSAQEWEKHKHEMEKMEMQRRLQEEHKKDVNTEDKSSQGRSLGKYQRCHTLMRVEISWIATSVVLNVLQNLRNGNELIGRCIFPHYSKAVHWTYTP